MYEHERFTHNGLTVKIMADDSPDSGNPRDADNVGLLVMVGPAEQNGYGDVGFVGRIFGMDSPDHIAEYHVAHDAIASCDERGLSKEAFARWARLNLGATVVLPVYLTVQSYATISVGALSDERPCAGFILDTARTRELTGAPVDSVEDQLVGEVAAYDAFLQGNVVGYTVEREQVCNLGHTHAETIGSCWGFLIVDEARDMENVRDEARDEADGYEHKTPDAPASPRIVVVIEGGLVQAVIADQAGVEITTLDYDTDGCDEQELADAVMVPQSPNSVTGEAYDPEPGFLTHWDAEHNPGDVEKVLTAPERGPVDTGKAVTA